MRPRFPVCDGSVADFCLVLQLLKYGECLSYNKTLDGLCIGFLSLFLSNFSNNAQCCHFCLFSFSYDLPAIHIQGDSVRVSIDYDEVGQFKIRKFPR